MTHLNRVSLRAFRRAGGGLLACLLLVAAAAGCRVLGGDAATVALYEPYTLCLNLTEPLANPFDPVEIGVEAVFTHESGAQAVVPGFWYQEFTCCRDDGTGAERLDPVGSPGFRVKFAPRHSGRWSWHWRITRNGHADDGPGGKLIVGPALSRGFVLRSPSPHYLMTSSGDPLFLVGQNVAWSTSPAPLADFTRTVDGLAASGQNCLRLWQCTWGLGIEHDGIGRYDLKRAWVLDQIIELARRRGVYIFFVLENAHDVHEKKSPYWQQMASPEEFFTSASLRTAFKNRMRYAAARWGCSTSILAWEFFNEMEYALLDPLELKDSVREQYFAPWLTEMATAMKSYDGHGHLLTNSLASDRVWDEMYEYPWLDIVQQHLYLRPWEADTVEAVVVSLEEVSRYDKPCLLGEFGGAPVATEGGGGVENLVNDNDPEGIHLHDSLWASAMIGAAGTPLHWWWDTYVRPRKLNRHYAAISRFLEGTPWLDPSLTTGFVPVNGTRILMLRGSGWARLWAQNRRFTWQPPETPEGVAPVEAFPLRLGNMPKGIYRVEWWDTERGCICDIQMVRCDGALTLNFPEFKHDIAARLWRVTDESAEKNGEK